MRYTEFNSICPDNTKNMPTLNQTPEQIARDNIDRQLRQAGWAVQDKDKSLADLDNLPDPDILAGEIIENIESALEGLKDLMATINGQD